MSVLFFLRRDEDGEVYEHVPPGHHQRVTWCTRRDNRVLRQPRARRAKTVGYIRDGSRKSLQTGPVPLPFAHRRTRWR